MKRSRVVLVAIISGIIIASTVGAVLFSGIFWGKQEGDIPLYGYEDHPLLFGTVVVPHGGQYVDVPLFSLTIPFQFSNFTAGCNITENHRIVSTDNVNSYNVSFHINNNWFNNPSHPFYGFTYGIEGTGGFYGNLNNRTVLIPPIGHMEFNFWYKVNPLMLTPPDGYVHPTIWINATKI
jgi:hypothetical protein